METSKLNNQNLPVGKPESWLFSRPGTVDHSNLSATIGSTFAARCAGTQQASSADTVSTKTISVNVSGSVGLTSNSNVFRNRVKANAPAVPSPTPSKTSFI